ncbi:hypothetical protein DPMN_169471 [Dreissena polymorpha]|uniref:Uncharacterized protein n=1 Tax=Dreissena polymorpha TaxID=45954 RepID=A0A9D4ICA0_DREPO|nr:hypothetical protein DPMN_169471 [Dreissena polymorpha]
MSEEGIQQECHKIVMPTFVVVPQKNKSTALRVQTAHLFFLKPPKPHQPARKTAKPRQLAYKQGQPAPKPIQPARNPPKRRQPAGKPRQVRPPPARLAFKSFTNFLVVTSTTIITVNWQGVVL